MGLHESKKITIRLVANKIYMILVDINACIYIYNYTHKYKYIYIYIYLYIPYLIKCSKIMTHPKPLPQGPWRRVTGTDAPGTI
jgi:hypothetical protein